MQCQNLHSHHKYNNSCVPLSQFEDKAETHVQIRYTHRCIQIHKNKQQEVLLNFRSYQYKRRSQHKNKCTRMHAIPIHMCIKKILQYMEIKFIKILPKWKYFYRKVNKKHKHNLLHTLHAFIHCAKIWENVSPIFSLLIIEECTNKLYIYTY